MLQSTRKPGLARHTTSMDSPIDACHASEEAETANHEGPWHRPDEQEHDPQHSEAPRQGPTAALTLSGGQDVGRQGSR